MIEDARGGYSRGSQFSRSQKRETSVVFDVSRISSERLHSFHAVCTALLGAYFPKG
jgi:hypothetical protein